MKYFFVGALLLVGTVIHAQRQANIWHFGDGRVIDFSTGVPVNGGSSSMTTFEGCASYCDDSGQLLFYTNGGGRDPELSGQDGGKIWNRNHDVLYDMQGVQGGGFSSAQSAVIFEAPSSASEYYVFTMDEIEFTVGSSPETNLAQPEGRGLSYFKVDMSLNGGLGEVTVTDQRLMVPSVEGVCAIRHSNEQDYWVLANDAGVALSVFKVDANGVTEHSSIDGETGGIIKASPNGRFVLVKPFLYSFDPATGLLSDPVNVSAEFEFFEFSPNSEYLYALRNNNNSVNVVRYSLSSTNVFVSEENLGFTESSFGSPAQMQLGPDGNIYFLEYDFLQGMKLSRITCPNTNSPSIESSLFTFGEPFFGLPNFSAWLFANNESFTIPLGPEQLVVCENDFPITLNAGDSGTSYQWSTGAVSSSIEVSSPGTYTVTVVGSCGTASASVEVLPCAEINECEVFLPTGEVQFFTVPEGVDSLFVKMWGAAGGAGPDEVNNGGGGGGYASFSLPVVAGDVLQIAVGVGGTKAEGNSGGAGGYPAGGAGGTGNRNELGLGPVGGGGGGGGKTIVRITGSQNALLAIAGGGGGGANNRYGGGGGGLEGEYSAANNEFSLNGFGGTQTSGGAPANNTLCPPPVLGEAGFEFGGGLGATDTAESSTGGGGGGDGYYGGGGGSSHDGCFGVGSSGGGGSGFLCADCIGFEGTLETAGFFGVPANASDPLIAAYPNTATGLPSLNGGGGLVQICFSNTDCLPVTTSLVVSSCGEYVSNAGNVYNVSGTFVETFVAVNGCDSLLTLNVTVNPVPVPTATATATTCGEDNGTLSASATGGATPYIFTWQPTGDSGSQTNVAAGEYILFALDANGCLSTDTVEVAASSAAEIDVSPSSAVIEEGGNVELEASGGVSYLWSPSDSLSCTDCANPIANPAVSTVYSLLGTDENGCTARINVLVSVAVDCGEPFIPTIFSPNITGPEENNLLCIEGKCIQRIEYEVYNRWGQRVFETTSLNNCWDGTFNGIDAEAGAYVYKALITLQSGKLMESSGILTLIR